MTIRSKAVEVGAIGLGLALWSVAIVSGTHYMFAYEYGVGRAASKELPDRPTTEQSKPLLVVAVHPQCPCSTATITELSELLADCRDAQIDSPNVRILVYSPRSESSNWVTDTAIYQRIAALPKDVTVILDRDGKRAQTEFGAVTSGQAFLYDRTGRLRYRGGLTLGRGVTGDNPSVRSVRQILTESSLPKNVSVITMPVFGCPLVDPPAQRERELP